MEDDKILSFLNAPILPEDCHIIVDAEQSNLTNPTTQMDRILDRSHRVNALHAVNSLALLHQLGSACQVFSQEASDATRDDRHFPMFLGIRGIYEASRNFQEALFSDLIKTAVKFRKSIREKSLGRINELGLKDKLLNSDPFAVSLFPSNSSQVVHDSIHSSAPRTISMKYSGSKGPGSFGPRSAGPDGQGQQYQPYRNQLGGLPQALNRLTNLISGQNIRFPHNNNARPRIHYQNPRFQNQNSFRQFGPQGYPRHTRPSNSGFAQGFRQFNPNSFRGGLQGQSSYPPRPQKRGGGGGKGSSQ